MPQPAVGQSTSGADDGYASLLAAIGAQPPAAPKSDGYDELLAAIAKPAGGPETWTRSDSVVGTSTNEPDRYDPVTGKVIRRGGFTLHHLTNERVAEGTPEYADSMGLQKIAADRRAAEPQPRDQWQTPGDVLNYASELGAAVREKPLQTVSDLAAGTYDSTVGWGVRGVIRGTGNALMATGIDPATGERMRQGADIMAKDSDALSTTVGGQGGQFVGQALPSALAMAATRGRVGFWPSVVGQTVGIGSLMAGSFEQGSKQYEDQMRAEGRPISPAMSLAIGSAYAAAEAVFEKVGIDAMGEVAGKAGHEMVDAILRRDATTLAKTLARIGLAGAVGLTEAGGVNATEEGLTQIAQNIIDRVGYAPDRDLTEGVYDSAFQGGLQGVMIGASGMTVDAANRGVRGAIRANELEKADKARQFRQAGRDITAEMRTTPVVEPETAPSEPTETPGQAAVRSALAWGDSQTRLDAIRLRTAELATERENAARDAERRAAEDAHLEAETAPAPIESPAPRVDRSPDTEEGGTPLTLSREEAKAGGWELGKYRSMLGQFNDVYQIVTDANAAKGDSNVYALVRAADGQFGIVSRAREAGNVGTEAGNQAGGQASAATNGASVAAGDVSNGVPAPAAVDFLHSDDAETIRGKYEQHQRQRSNDDSITVDLLSESGNPIIDAIVKTAARFGSRAIVVRSSKVGAVPGLAIRGGTMVIDMASDGGTPPILAHESLHRLQHLAEAGDTGAQAILDDIAKSLGVHGIARGLSRYQDLRASHGLPPVTGAKATREGQAMALQALLEGPPKKGVRERAVHRLLLNQFRTGGDTFVGHLKTLLAKVMNRIGLLDKSLHKPLLDAVDEWAKYAKNMAAEEMGRGTDEALRSRVVGHPEQISAIDIALGKRYGAWITPDGKIYDVPHQSHWEVAKKLAKQYRFKQSTNSHLSSEDRWRIPALGAGFVRVVWMGNRLTLQTRGLTGQSLPVVMDIAKLVQTKGAEFLLDDIKTHATVMARVGESPSALMARLRSLNADNVDESLSEKDERATADAIAKAEPEPAKEERVRGGIDDRGIDVLRANLYQGNIGDVVAKELLQNSIDATRGRDDATVSLAIDTISHFVQIVDNGTGMTPEVMRKEFMDIGGSKKPEGASGGFGIAKVAILGNAADEPLSDTERTRMPDLGDAQNQDMPIYVSSVAEAPGGGRVRSTLTGFGKDWFGEGFKFSTQPVPLSTPTGTEVFIRLRDDAKLNTYETKRKLLTYLNDSLLPDLKLNLKLDGVDLQAGMGQWSTQVDDAAVVSKKPVGTLTLTNAVIDVHSASRLRKQSYMSYTILNNGMPQFSDSIRVPSDEAIPLPENVLVNVKASVPTTDDNYPFSASRESLKNDVRAAINEWLLNNLVGNVAAAQKDKYRKMFTEAEKIVGVKGVTARIVRADEGVSAETIKELAARPYSKELYRAMAVIIKDASERLGKYLGESNATNFHFFGFSPAADFHGINIRGKALGSDRNAIVLNPWSHWAQAKSSIVNQVVGPEETQAQLAAGELVATAIHEIVHQVSWNHNSDFAGNLTRAIAVLGPMQSKWARKIARIMALSQETLDADTDNITGKWGLANLLKDVGSEHAADNASRQRRKDEARTGGRGGDGEDARPFWAGPVRAGQDVAGGNASIPASRANAAGDLPGADEALRDPTKGRNFKRWFKDSKIVDEDGKPLAVYHGTTRDFRRFSRQQATPEGDWGRGFYFSNSVDDVGHNYAGVGPDLKNKIEALAEQIEYEMVAEMDEPPYDAVSRAPVALAARQEAERRLTQHGGAVLKVYLSIKNPVILPEGDNGGTWLDSEVQYADPNDPDSDIVGVNGKLHDFLEAFEQNALSYADTPSLIDLPLIADDVMGEGMSAIWLIKALEKNDLLQIMDDEGRHVGAEVIRQSFEDIGFDGVIDRHVDKKFGTQARFAKIFGGQGMKGVDPDTVHYIAFRPEQVKSATGNNGKYGIDNPNIDEAVNYRPSDNPAFRKWFRGSKVTDDNNAPMVVYHGTVSGGFRSFETKRQGTRTGAASARRAFFFTDSTEVANTYAEGGATNETDAEYEYSFQVARLQSAMDSLDRKHATTISAEPDGGGLWDVKLQTTDEWGSGFDYWRTGFSTKEEAIEAAQQELDDDIEQTEEFISELEKKVEQAKQAAGAGRAIYPVYLSLKNPLVHDYHGESYRDTTYNDLLKKAAAEGHDGAIFLNTYDANAGSGGKYIDSIEPHTVYAVFRGNQIKSATGNRGTWGPDTDNIDESLTHTREFKKWFGEWDHPLNLHSKAGEGFNHSSMVMRRGVPLVVYHGTRQDFRAFDPERKGVNVDGFGGVTPTRRAGFFFSEDPRLAEQFAASYPSGPTSDRLNAGANIKPVYLNIKSPFWLDNGLQDYQEEELREAGINVRWIHNADSMWELFDEEPGREFVAALKNLGYDGAVFREDGAIKKLAYEEGPFRVWVAFDQNQIKSALGNRGTFDAASPNIDESLRHPEEAANRLIASAIGSASKPVAKALRGVVSRLASGKAGPAIDAMRGAVRRVGLEVVPDRLLVPEWVSARNAAEMEGRYGKAVAAAYGTLLHYGGESKMLGFEIDKKWVGDAANRRLMGDVLVGDKPLSALPAEYQPVARNVRDALDSLGQQAVNAGYLTQETFDRNKGKYLPRLYSERELDKRGLRGAVNRLRMNNERRQPRLSDAFAVVDNKGNPIDGPSGTFRFASALERDQFLDGLIQTTTVAEVNRAIRGSGQSITLTDLAPINLGRLSQPLQQLAKTTRAEVAARYAKNDPKTDAELDAMGLIREAAYPVATAMMQLRHDLSLLKFYGKMAMTPSVSSTTETAYFNKQVPQTPKYGALAGMWLPEELHRDLANLHHAPGIALEAYRSMMNAWKFAKTVLSPATWGRNFIGNFQFADLAGIGLHDPRSWPHYVRGVMNLAGKNGPAILQEMQRHGVIGTEFNVAELGNVLNELGTSLNTKVSPAVWMWQLVRAGLGKAADGYGVIDQIFKAASYAHQRDMGVLPKDAADHVRKWFPDYSRVPKTATMRATRDVVFPFFSFYYEALRINALAAKEKPLTLAKWIAVPWLVTQLSYGLLGAGGDDKDKIAEELKGAGLFSMLLPFRDANGRLIQWDLTNIIPTAGVTGLRSEANPLEDKTLAENLLGGFITSNPLSNLAITFGMNEDPFFKRPVFQTGMTPGEKAMAAFNVVRKTAQPGIVGAIETNIAAGHTQKSTLDKRDRLTTALRTTVGMDIKSADPMPRRMIDDFIKRHGRPVAAEYGGDTTPRQRAAREMYQALLDNDQTDFNRALQGLEEVGAPVKTFRQLEESIKSRHPLARIRTEDRPTFMRELTPEQRRVIDSALTEYKTLIPRALQLWGARLQPSG